MPIFLLHSDHHITSFCGNCEQEPQLLLR